MQTTNNTHATTSADAIASEAFYQWLQAGKPYGRDQEFWLKAETRLRNGGGTVKATEKKTAATSSTKAKAPAKK